MEIKASDVMKLRQMTGASMMECKKVLEEWNGRFDVAYSILSDGDLIDDLPKMEIESNYSSTKNDNKPLPIVDSLTGEVIKVVDDNGSYGSYVNKINPRIQLIGINNLNSISDKYALPSSIYPGDILFKHPFLPDSYVSASLSEQEFFKQKLKCFASICQELGAKSVSGNAEWVDSQELECGYGGEISVKGVSLGASYVSSEKSRIEKSYYLKQNYAGGKPDVARAEQLAKRYGLWNDFDVRDLIESRTRNNSILSQDVRIALSTELNRSKEIAFSLNVLSIFKLSGSIADSMSRLNNVSITLQVGF